MDSSLESSCLIQKNLDNFTDFLRTTKVDKSNNKNTQSIVNCILNTKRLKMLIINNQNSKIVRRTNLVNDKNIITFYKNTKIANNSKIRNKSSILEESKFISLFNQNNLFFGNYLFYMFSNELEKITNLFFSAFILKIKNNFNEAYKYRQNQKLSKFNNHLILSASLDKKVCHAKGKIILEKLKLKQDTGRLSESVSPLVTSKLKKVVFSKYPMNSNLRTIYKKKCILKNQNVEFLKKYETINNSISITTDRELYENPYNSSIVNEVIKNKFNNNPHLGLSNTLLQDSTKNEFNLTRKNISRLNIEKVINKYPKVNKINIHNYSNYSENKDKGKILHLNITQSDSPRKLRKLTNDDPSSTTGTTIYNYSGVIELKTISKFYK